MVYLVSHRGTFVFQNMKRFLHYFICLVWLVNGLVCKVLNLVPRHEEIVGQLLSSSYARPLTLTIGILEIGISIWIFTRLFPRLAAIFQMLLVLLMNIIETIFVPELLLWGRWNLVFAMLFVGIIYVEAFVLKTAKT